MRWKVLVADDDKLIRQAVSDVLADDDQYGVLVASDGDEAIQVCLAEQPDLILLDLNLPKKDGWAVCRFLKNNPTTAHMYVVALSGLTQDSVRRKTLQTGVDAFIKKPFRARHLLDVMEELLGE